LDTSADAGAYVSDGVRSTVAFTVVITSHSDKESKHRTIYGRLAEMT